MGATAKGLPGAGGGERTGPKKISARANADGGGKCPAAADGAPGAAAADGPTPTLRTAAPPALVARARAGVQGVCILCFSTDRIACEWVDPADRRLCTAHTAVELRQGSAALASASQAKEEGR